MLWWSLQGCLSIEFSAVNKGNPPETHLDKRDISWERMSYLATLPNWVQSTGRWRFPKTSWHSSFLGLFVENARNFGNVPWSSVTHELPGGLMWWDLTRRLLFRQVNVRQFPPSRAHEEGRGGRDAVGTLNPDGFSRQWLPTRMLPSVCAIFL